MVRTVAVAVAAVAIGGLAIGGGGPARATSGVSTPAGADALVAQASSPGSFAATDVQDITIEGTADPSDDGGGASAANPVLDGNYVISAGGTRTTAVLGAMTFDPNGTVVGGEVTVIAAATTPASTTTSTTTSTTAAATGITTRATANPTPETAAAVNGALLAPADVGAGGAGATVTECTVMAGSYSLSATGAGEAQLRLGCAGSAERTVTWKLFVTAGDGFGPVEQVRAVQLEAWPMATDSDIVDLTLTLR